MNTKRGFVRCQATGQLDTEALRLRSSNLTYEEIGRRMGCNKTTALRRCERALGEIPRETADSYRKLEDMRLDELSCVLWPLVMAGNLRAIDRLLSISKRRAKLWGLDAAPPSRSRKKRQTAYFSTEQNDEEVARLTRALAESRAVEERAKESVMTLLPKHSVL
jgi:hypothetical protein